MEMVYHNEDREYGNIPDASVRHVESKICSDDDRKWLLQSLMLRLVSKT
ncbi:hypothetical protein FQN60_009252 [Etheostoma spectabile]|uniref:Uncharacterized protein n=1 Tax=Etheostoma spectabile TaxID=54343 RepID=A0A5J5CB07_9PERO|nr:hypothetical protein FQN60_009252 [Etheostoma spectabile]